MSGYLFLSAAETTKPVSDFLKVWKAGAHSFTRAHDTPHFSPALKLYY